MEIYITPLIEKFDNQELTIIPNLKRSDEDEFKIAFQTYHTFLYFYALKLLNDSEDAKEAIQNVYFRFWERRNKININFSVKYYLLKSIYNECLNKIKQKKIHYKAIIELQKYFKDETEHNKINFCGNSELVKIVDETIDLLPPKCKSVFILSRIHHYKNKEIAVHLKLSPKTVENHVTKALKIFRVALFDYIN